MEISETCLGLNVKKPELCATEEALELLAVDLDIIPALSLDFDIYLDNLRSGVFINKKWQRSTFSIELSNGKNYKRVSLKINKLRRTMFNLSNGLLFNNKTKVIRYELSDIEQLRKDLEYNEILIQHHYLDGSSPLDVKVEITVKFLQKMFPNLFNVLKDYERKEMVPMWSLINSIQDSIFLNINLINKTVESTFISYIRTTVEVEHKLGLQSNQGLFQIADLMGLGTRYYHSIKWLSEIPKENQTLYFKFFSKYPLAITAVDKLKTFRKYDPKRLIENDAHPKRLKEVLIKFYSTECEFKITEKIITKILRHNPNDFGELYYHFYSNKSLPYNIDKYLLLIFCDMPQVSYLNDLEVNSNLIYNYSRAFYSIFLFLDTIHITSKYTKFIPIVKAILRTYRDYQKLEKVFDSARHEFKRLQDLIISGQGLGNEFEPLKNIERWSMKKITKFHDICSLVCQNILSEKNVATKQLSEQSNKKIFEPIEIDGYIFQQLTTVEELNRERRVMHHCIHSYYGANVSSATFCFAVYHVELGYLFSNKDRSTIAVFYDEEKYNISLAQNYTTGNTTPSKENQLVVKKFVQQLSSDKLPIFRKYTNEANKINQISNSLMRKVDYNKYIQTVLIEMGVQKNVEHSTMVEGEPEFRLGGWNLEIKPGHG
jgi:hypothetical protein